MSRTQHSQETPLSHFPQPGYYDPNMTPVEPARKSGLAVTSLVMSLIGVIPCLGLLTAPIGVLLGCIGVVAIRPPKTGKGMAVAAILIGVVTFSVQAYFSKKAYDFMYGFYALMMKGPNDALALGASGDIAGFKASFVGSGASASDDEARAFLDALRDRYGNFQSAELDQSAGPPPTGTGQPAIVMPYVLRFDSRVANCEAEVVLADQATGDFVKKIGYIRVIDASAGDLVYPPGAVAEPPAGNGADADADSGGTSDPDTPNG